MFRYYDKILFKKNNYSSLYKRKDLIIKKQKKNINNEINILKNLNHKNVIKLLNNYSDLYYDYYVMPYYEKGDLFYNLYESDNLKFNQKETNIEFLKKLVNPIYYIHSNNIVHLDLKLENYLYHDNSFILCDFNISKYHHKLYYKLENIEYVVGTKYYIAPEVKNGCYCKASDIYSLGSIIYLLYTNTNLYNNKINYDLLKNTPKPIITIIEDCLQENQNHRPTIFDFKYYYLT